MPLFQIQSSSVVDSAPVLSGLLKTLSSELARELGKPESYLMVSFENDAKMLFGGSNEPCCFAVLKNIGTFTPAQTERLSRLLTDLLSSALAVPPSRIYLEFVDAKPHLWSHGGATFA
jgi:phenylpyruvate tautomerase PptA (4-oxalocrotonate tautomerase family)